ncbi:helix-turn-helix transcriptional regulator [Microbacterium sp. 2C]|nr:helix-turn-helix transcriptional regulator [Microbacterium paulum]
MDLIVRARARAGMSQQELAQRASVSIGTVRRLCSGSSPEPGFFVVQRIMAALLVALHEADERAAARCEKEYMRILFPR